MLPKEILNCLTEWLCGPLRLSGVDSILTWSSSCQEAFLCRYRTCQVSLKRSHLVDYEGNTAMWGDRLWTCELVQRCVLFIHIKKFVPETIISHLSVIIITFGSVKCNVCTLPCTHESFKLYPAVKSMLMVQLASDLPVYKTMNFNKLFTRRVKQRKKLWQILVKITSVENILP